MRKKDYKNILHNLIIKIRTARRTTAITINAQLLVIYWEIGITILEQQKEKGWGAKIIDKLSADLISEFPEMKGLSVRNLKYMRAFAEAYPYFLKSPETVESGEKLFENKTATSSRKLVQSKLAQRISSSEFVQVELAQISWYHHITLLDKVKNEKERLFYIRRTIENGWSRDVLVLQIENNLYRRQGKAITNFDLILSPVDSDLAKETLKNPYIFDFLMIENEIREKDLENALIQHLKKFMLELGKGFAYVGRQYNLCVSGDDFFFDLLFYNFHLHCFVVFELKIGEFKPEFAGKLNFYINAIDEQIKSKSDKPTIGILLCKTPNKLIVKYALKGLSSPIGVAEYKLTKNLPVQLKADMPTIQELETSLNKNNNLSTKRNRK
jgi:predicted nuclease of restriction endonuclease-like (RecB) superfamily